VRSVRVNLKLIAGALAYNDYKLRRSSAQHPRAQVDVAAVWHALTRGGRCIAPL
jgi:hypothetical protein